MYFSVCVAKQPQVIGCL